MQTRMCKRDVNLNLPFHQAFIVIHWIFEVIMLIPAKDQQPLCRYCNYFKKAMHFGK